MKGFKTIAYGALLAALSILSNPEMQIWVGENLPYVGSGIATGIIILRALTNSPMFKKEPE